MDPAEEAEIRCRLLEKYQCTPEQIEWYIDNVKLARAAYKRECQLHEDYLLNQLSI